MNFNRTPFATPFFDPTGLGFAVPKPERLNWRAITIATICFDPIEREAVFVNADGYAAPLEPHPYEIKRLLELAVSREFGKVCGSGQFAMKPARLGVLQNQGQLKRWIAYHLAQPAHYANDPATWAAYLETDLLEERRAIEAGKQALAALRHPLAEQTPRPTADAIERRRAALMDEYRQRKVENDAVNAWLRGDASTPPLLQALAADPLRK
ncbi:hypothetical protein V8Z77_08260 [Stutzerimonas stutzeri]|uniref:hypothetical protein n=1 Tax=Stutzerimonas stutzeri TaxID=316 RepID=UPI0031DA2ABD